MAWSYRRSVKIMPGVRMNLSKSGVGFSYGGRGGRITKSPNGRETYSASIPGTGLRYRKTIKPADRKTLGDNYSRPKRTVPTPLWRGLLVINTFIFIASTGALFSKPAPGDGPKSGLIPVFIVIAFVYLLTWANFKANKPKLLDEEVEETFLTSKYNRNPSNPEEWESTVNDYRAVVDCLQKCVDGKSDNSQAPEFPVSKNEVVFLKLFGASTNEQMTKVVGGVIYITNKKISFLGTNRNREWQFSKMTNFLPYDNKGVILFQNIDQKTVTGICIPKRDDFFKFQFFVSTAYSLNKYQPAEVLRQFQESLEKFEAEKPSGNVDAN